MKRLLLILALAAFTFGAGAQTTDTLRILAIGNSFSEDAVEENLWELLNEAGIPAVIGNMYIGGCSLERHWDNAVSDKGAYRYRKVRNGKTEEKNGVSLSRSLADENWQYVSFQQSSPFSGRYDTYKPYLANLIRYVQDKTGKGTRLIFHQTWAYAKDSDHPSFPDYDKDQDKMYRSIMDASQNALRQNPEITILVPDGTAIQNARTSSLGDTMNRDGYHLNKTYGRFAAACTWYAVLSGKKAANNPWKQPGMDDKTAAICKKAADMAIANPFRITAFDSEQANAEIILPNLVGDNMVLQRNGTAKIWGVCNSGRKVCVRTSWNGKKYSVTPDENGNWSVDVATGKEGGPYTVEIKAKQKITLSNVFLGEVWICSGQSNMEMPVFGFDHQPVEGAMEAALKAGETPLIHMYTVPRARANAPQCICGGEWKTSTPDNVGGFSATAFFFGRTLSQNLPGVPIGLIASDWGGTGIECWMSREALESTQGIDLPTAMRINWDDIRPGQLFNGMIYPLHNYTAKGFIWYQGEANRINAIDYPAITASKVKEWRSLWGNDKMPYYLVQIAPYRYDNPDFRSAPLFVEQQYRIPSLVPYSGVAPTTDIGARDVIHPPFKQEVGRRLAYLALTKDYGIHGLPTTPQYKSMEIKGDRIRLTFDGVSAYGNCFKMFKDGKSMEIKGFEIAGPDRIWHDANASIVWNTNQIEVWCEDIKNPVAVRYAFRNWTEGANVETDLGIPLPPFRTDSWTVTDLGVSR